MIFHLITQTLGPNDRAPVTEVHVIEGDTMADIWEQIQAHPQHIYNLKKNGHTSFRDVDGVRHQWLIKEIIGPN